MTKEEQIENFILKRVSKDITTQEAKEGILSLFNVSNSFFCGGMATANNRCNSQCDNCNHFEKGIRTNNC